MDPTVRAATRILVVDDDRLSRELVVELLEAVGYSVLQAEDGAGLLERVKEEQPALILMDLQLPGLDGFTLIRQLKTEPATKEIPILAMTAHAQPEDQERALAARCNDCITKPLSTAGLLQTVARLLRR